MKIKVIGMEEMLILYQIFTRNGLKFKFTPVGETVWIVEVEKREELSQSE